ncbi:MAG: transglycosylase domain-containing protein [Bacteroidetes bacterium]|nr:transglycosylase domain-containing protein [Bacteroidota bacterium]
MLLVAFVFGILDITFSFTPQPSWSKVVYDRKGKVLNVFLSADDKWRMACTPESVDRLLLETLIRKEDRFFYYHPGFNPMAIVRAGFNNVIKGQRTSGASTITMQVGPMAEILKV